jgi:hypothetical protein
MKAAQAKAAQDLAQRHRLHLDTELRIVQRRNLIRELEQERIQSEEVSFGIDVLSVNRLAKP